MVNFFNRQTWQRIFVVFQKEVLDNARDRRSLLIALIYPLMGPLLLSVMISMVVTVTSSKKVVRETLYVHGIEYGPDLVAWLEKSGITVVEAPSDPKQAVQRGEMETVLLINPLFSEKFLKQETADVSVIVNTSRLPGLIAVNRLAGLLGKYNQTVWGERISQRGIDYQVLQPLNIKSVNVTSGAHISDIFLYMVPPLIIFNLFMGGVYLAIDTTSGERERGSLESLLINPIERWGLMTGKYMAALLYTSVAVVVQLFAFKFGFHFVGSSGSVFSHSLSLLDILLLFLAMFPLMMFAVSLQFIIATLTRSFKEAQTYLGLLPLVPAIPGMVMVFAPVQTQDWMMTIPAFSQTLLLGQIVRQEEIMLSHVSLSVGGTMLISLALLMIAARLYRRETLIFGG